MNEGKLKGTFTTSAGKWGETDLSSISNQREKSLLNSSGGYRKQNNCTLMGSALAEETLL